MSVVHIFNPSHDEALAANTPYYTPAKAAAVLEYDLAALPAWWACQDDIVLVPKGHALDGQRINGCVLTSAPDWGKSTMCVLGDGMRQLFGASSVWAHRRICCQQICSWMKYGNYQAGKRRLPYWKTWLRKQSDVSERAGGSLPAMKSGNSRRISRRWCSRPRGQAAGGAYSKCRQTIST